jgi:Hg(II)-responsive transcriptional regulator
VSAPLTISHLARSAGVNVETIRYYERRGILRQPSKPPRGWRTYDDDALRVVRFVKRAQMLGFTLEEIEQLLELRRSASPRTCARVSEGAQRKIVEIDAKLQDLTAMRRVLEDLAKTCHKSEGSERCPILDAFDRG